MLNDAWLDKRYYIVIAFGISNENRLYCDAVNKFAIELHWYSSTPNYIISTTLMIPG